MEREVTDTDGTTWTCVQAFSGERKLMQPAFHRDRIGAFSETTFQF